VLPKEPIDFAENHYGSDLLNLVVVNPE